MTASLTEVISERRRQSVDRAKDLAEKLGDSRQGSVTAQVAIENALRDVRLYRSLEVDLREVAGDSGIYGRHSKRSLIADLHSAPATVMSTDDARGDGGDAAARIKASNREAAADAGLETRDLGAGLAAAVVPNWLVNEARPVAIKRAPLVTAVARPLPMRGLVVQLPQFTTEPVAGPQATLNSALVTATFVDDDFEAPVRTFGVQVKIPQVIVELNPLMLDRQVLPALVASVDAAIEESLWSGANTGGHVKGILAATGTSTETYTDTTPTLLEAHPKVEALVRKVETAGAYGGTPIVAMHPRRLSWFRQAAVAEKVDLGWSPAPFPGATAGWFGGNVAVIADSAAPTTRGTGTNEDAVVVMRSLDVLDLFTSPPMVRVTSDSVGSGALSATVTVSRMVAFSAERLAGAVGVLSGTGLAAP